MSATETTTDTPAPTETPAVTLTLAEQVRKVLHDAVKPLALSAVKTAVNKYYPKGTKKPSNEAIEQELKAPDIHVHPELLPGGKQTFWHKAPALPLDVQILKLFGPTDKKKSNEIIAALDRATKPKVTAALNQLVAEDKLFVHGSGRNIEYATHVAPQPLTVAEQVTEKVQAIVAKLGEELVTVNQLGKPSARQGAEAAEAFDQVLKKLVADKKLFAYAGGKYSRKEPILPEWYETSPHKTPFEAMLKKAKDLFAVGVTTDQLFIALRKKLGLILPPPIPDPEPPLPPPPVIDPPPVTPPDLRTVLKQAYDHLCQFPEFRDKLVELPSLYHDAVERMPGLTSAKFQHELWQMSTEWVIELHVLNETYLAKEPHLAIHRNDRLYYYARWK